MSIIEFFDNMEKKDFLWSSIIFVITFILGFVWGLIAPYTWMVIAASIIAGLYIFWSFMFVIINWREWRKETEILVELPSFPQKDFCDMCSKELEGGERRTDGEFLVIICPHCEAENFVSSEKKIQQIEEEVKEE